jgi:hypothetical protein
VTGPFNLWVKYFFLKKAESEGVAAAARKRKGKQNSNRQGFLIDQ